MTYVALPLLRGFWAVPSLWALKGRMIQCITYLHTHRVPHGTAGSVYVLGSFQQTPSQRPTQRLWPVHRSRRFPGSPRVASGFSGDASPNCPLPPPGGPSPAPLHPKRSPTSTGEAELKEERLPSRKASCSTAGSGSRGLPPSSPMVSSAHNPNKAEIPERRKDSTSTPVSGRAGGQGRGVTAQGPATDAPGLRFFRLGVSHPVPQPSAQSSL